MHKVIEVSKCPDVNWRNDHLQFARLIAEAIAADGFGEHILCDLAKSMDLPLGEIYNIIDRACDAWDEAKDRRKTLEIDDEA